MRGVFLGVLAAAALFVAPVWSQASAQEQLSAGQIADVLKNQGYVVQDFGGEMIGVAVGEQIVLIGVHGSDGDVTYITYLPELSIRELGYPFLNKFNNGVKFGRAYVDRDGDIAIQMDRNSAGGISRENVVSDFQVFLLLVTKFLNDLATASTA